MSVYTSMMHCFDAIVLLSRPVERAAPGGVFVFKNQIVHSVNVISHASSLCLRTQIEAATEVT